jgi:Zn-dependent protease/CBS domain-containing protein
LKRHTIPLGRILGIPISLDYSWFLIFVLLTWSLAVGYYPAEFKNWSTALYWIVSAVTAIMLFVSVLLHELGHSIVALHFKIPVQGITLFVFGGAARFAARPAGAAAEFWTAIAGPAASFALAALFGLLQLALTGIVPLLALSQFLIIINGSLGLLNLIPGFPLDGGRVLQALFWGRTHSLRKATLIVGFEAQFIAFVFIIVGMWQLFSGNFIYGLWIVFLGFFVESAAMGEALRHGLRGLLVGQRVSQAMNRSYAAIPADTTLQQLATDHILDRDGTGFAVEQGNEVVGFLTLPQLKDIPQADWSRTTAAQAAARLNQVKQVQPDTELWSALDELGRDGVNQLPVIKDGQIVGMLSREDVISYLRTVQELDTT